MIAHVEQLKMLDGTEIYPSERLAAQQMMQELEEDLQVAKELAKIEKEKKRIANENKHPDDQTEAYSRESRR